MPLADALLLRTVLFIRDHAGPKTLAADFVPFRAKFSFRDKEIPRATLRSNPEYNGQDETRGEEGSLQDCRRGRAMGRSDKLRTIPPSSIRGWRSECDDPSRSPPRATTEGVILSPPFWRRAPVVLSGSRASSPVFTPRLQAALEHPVTRSWWAQEGSWATWELTRLRKVPSCVLWMFVILSPCVFRRL